MVVRTVCCTECRETRAGRDIDDEVLPYRDDCPNCGSTEFEVLGQ